MYVADIGVKCSTCGVKFNSRQLPAVIDIGYRNSELRQFFKGVIPQYEEYFVITCPSCGRADWSTSFEVIEEPAYLNAPATTAHLQFRQAAMTAEKEGRSFYNIAYLYLYAAWCADDRNASVQAFEYRRLAADAFSKSLVDGSCPADKKAETEYLIAEILRRAGDFAASREYFVKIVGRLPSHFAIMARKLMRLCEVSDSQAIDFVAEVSA